MDGPIRSSDSSGFVSVTYMPLPVIVTWLDALFRRAQSTKSYLLYSDAILSQKSPFLRQATIANDYC